MGDLEELLEQQESTLRWLARSSAAAAALVLPDEAAELETLRQLAEPPTTAELHALAGLPPGERRPTPDW